jgi:hypothetical protein
MLAGTFGTVDQIDGRLLVTGIGDFRDDGKSHLGSASGEVQVAIERDRNRRRHRLIHGQCRVNGHQVLVCLDERPGNFYLNVLRREVGIDADVGDRRLAHDQPAARQEERENEEG